MSTKQWPYARWCRWLDRRTGFIVHRGRAEKYYKARIKPSAILHRPLVLAYIIPTDL